MDITIFIVIVVALCLLLALFFMVRKNALKKERSRTKANLARAKQYPNEIYIPLMCEYLCDTKTVELNLKGNSMRPFLESDRDHGFLLKPNGVKKGDVVLAEIEPKHFVLHRIDSISVNGKVVKGICTDLEADITLRGDGNPKGTETCKLNNIKALCVKVNRNGKIYDLNTSKAWKIYSWWWTHTLPTRRYQLALYKLFWRHEMPNRWKRK